VRRRSCACRPRGGMLIHAALRLGDSQIFLVDDMPEPREEGVGSPQLGGIPVTIHLFVEDVDVTIARAAAAGAKITMPTTRMFWGDRYSRLQVRVAVRACAVIASCGRIGSPSAGGIEWASSRRLHRRLAAAPEAMPPDRRGVGCGAVPRAPHGAYWRAQPSGAGHLRRRLGSPVALRRQLTRGARGNGHPGAAACCPRRKAGPPPAPGPPAPRADGSSLCPPPRRAACSARP